MNKFLSLSLIFTLSASLHAMENNGKNPVYSDDEEIAMPETSSTSYTDFLIDDPTDHVAPTATPSGAQESDLQSINNSELSIEEKKKRVFQLPFALSSGFDALKNDALSILLKLMNEENFNYKNELPVFQYAFSHDGRYCAISNSDEENECSSVHIINLISMSKVYTDKYDSNIEQIKFSPNSKLLLIMSNAGDVEIINLDDYSCLSIDFGGQYSHHGNLVTFSPDSQYLVSSSNPYMDTPGQVIRLSDRKEMFQPEDIFECQLSPDAKYLAISTREKAQILDFPSMQILRTINDNESSVHSFAFDSESKYLAIARGNTVKIIDLEAMSGIHTVGYDAAVQLAQFSPDSKYLATIRHCQGKYCHGTLHIIDCASMKELYSVEILLNEDEVNQIVESFAFSPDSKYCATITQNGTAARLIDLASGKTIHSEEALGVRLKSVRFSPDSQYLAVRQKATVKIIDLASMSTILTVPCDALYDVTFSHDSKYCAATPCNKAFSIIEIQKLGNILNGMNLHEFELLKALDSTRSTALQYKSVLNIPRMIYVGSESLENFYLRFPYIRIHATPEQWATWQTLKEKLPTEVQDILMRVICNADQMRQKLKRKKQTNEEQPSEE